MIMLSCYCGENKSENMVPYYIDCALSEGTNIAGIAVVITVPLNIVSCRRTRSFSGDI